jgi:AraC-like DNA-binding protein
VARPDLMPRADRRLAERLAELPDWDARFGALERLLTRALERPSQQAAMVRWACERIDAAHGGLGMRGLARELGYSEKHVTRMFRDQVGIAPKAFARLVRFDHLAQRLRRGPGASWSELAADLGFYDQAHLVREVRHFAATTPTALRAELRGLDPALL